MVCFKKYQVKPTCEEMASLLVVNDVRFSREEVTKGAGSEGSYFKFVIINGDINLRESAGYKQTSRSPIQIKRAVLPCPYTVSFLF